MTERSYEVITRSCAAAGVIAVLLYDRFPGLQGLALGLGAIAGVVSFATYSKNLSTSRNAAFAAASETSDIHAANALAAPEFVDVSSSVEEIPPSIDEASTSVEYIRLSTVDIQEVADRKYFEDLLWSHPCNHLRGHSHQRFEIGTLARQALIYYAESPSLYERHLTAVQSQSVVRNAIEIAMGLSSDKFEVVLSIHGDITIRKCSLDATVAEKIERTQSLIKEHEESRLIN